MNRPLILRGTPKHYHWGKSRSDSIICKIFPELESERPMAEYWLGAHPSGPALVRGNGQDILLTELLRDHAEEILGPAVLKDFGRSLPFLFKILSVNEPLSLQAHPDISLAKELHSADPLNYPDAHHKPEVAVAISHCELFCGLRIPVESFRSTLKLTREETALEVSKLRQRLAAKEISGREAAVLGDLLERFPGEEIGVLFASMLNFLELNPGDAVYIPAGVIHGHLSGELLECQASSDNVIRLALTPKHRDIPALERLLCRQLQEAPQPQLITAGRSGLSELPVSEFCFEVLSGSLQTGRKQVAGPELIFSLDAKGSLKWDGDQQIECAAGTSLLIPHSLSAYQLNISSGRLARVSVPPVRNAGR